MKVQPTKIILINSANCQYAEFDLSDSLHFIARNNCGKTSIINTLQFLYIDNHKEIDLGYTLDESWKHYFPKLGSYVLFELNTLTGKKVFGLAACGLGSQPEKFLYSGAYQVEDFLEDKKSHYTPKKPDTLFAQLSTKHIIRKLESKNHRDLLRPFEQRKNPSGLGLIGDTRDYRLFKRLFRQLLKLKSITIKDLKTQVECVNHRVMEKEKFINVQREFNEPYNKIQKQQGELQGLQSNKMNIIELLELSEDQTKQQGRLISYSLKSAILFVSEEKQLNEQRQIDEDQMLKLKQEKLPEIKLSREQKQHTSSQKSENLGVIKDQIKKYEKLEKECLQIVVELEKASLHNLQQQQEKFQEQLFNAKDENLDQLEQSLQFKCDQMHKQQKQLDGIADTLFAQLKKLLDDNELRQLYQISNPELWMLFDNKGFTVHNTEALQCFLKDSLERVKDKVLELPGLSLQLSDIASNTLYGMGDPDFLSNKISEIKQEISQLKNKITAIQEQEKIRRQLEQTQLEIKAIESKLDSYKKWESGKQQYQQSIQQRDTSKLEISKIQLEIIELNTQEATINSKINQLAEFIGTHKKNIEELSRQKQWIERHPADTNWTAIEVNYDTPSFTELYNQYKKIHEDLEKKSASIKIKTNNLRSVFSQLMAKSDEQALAFLQQELDSIPEQEKSINDEWRRIFTSFAAHCRGMIDSVDAIDGYLADLNRLLSKEKISNLQSVKIILKTNQWYQHILNIKQWKEHDLPLFAGINQDAIAKLQNAVKPLLEKVKVSISDLYDLELLVTDAHGNKKKL